MFASRIRRSTVVVVLVGALAAAGCGSSPTSPTPADPTGTWVGTAGNGSGTIAVTLVLATGSNGYQGTIRDDAGRIGQNTPVLNVTWDGTWLTFVFQMADGTGVSVTAQINGDSLIGAYADSQSERGTVQCSRQR